MKTGKWLEINLENTVSHEEFNYPDKIQLHRMSMGASFYFRCKTHLTISSFQIGHICTNQLLHVLFEDYLIAVQYLHVSCLYIVTIWCKMQLISVVHTDKKLTLLLSPKLCPEDHSSSCPECQANFHCVTLPRSNMAKNQQLSLLIRWYSETLTINNEEIHQKRLCI